ncbi:MAG: T9SS type A sorting domain-containing protein [Bacteroidetes bacterium]|nr:T9SS type A sorting domain-containing protein [Bacteroidota bacterium]MCW5895564.1 T9SS type A sorting domain-containing protein [Bacteroidota bacterium]
MVDPAGRMVIHRHGIPRYISHVVSESPGTPFTTGVRGDGGVPYEFRLEQNYPNPFNPTTAISYQLSAVGHVTLKVFDVLGREVATLVDEVKHAGRYSAFFDATGLPSGVYFYRLTAGSQVETKRMMVLK